MSSPFPGMDPYLEHPGLWPDVHNTLIVAIKDELAPRVRPRYLVRIEERTYRTGSEDLLFVGRPDLLLATAGSSEPSGARSSSASSRATTVMVPMPDYVRETYLEIRLVGKSRVVTALELLSWDNKRPGKGRRQYLKKRGKVLESRTHLVEVDLLREGEAMPLDRLAPRSDYSILVSRGEERPRALHYGFDLPDPIPRITIPLLSGDPEPELDLGRLIGEVYERSGYDLSVDYRQEATPPVPEAHRAWAETLLRQAGLR